RLRRDGRRDLIRHVSKALVRNQLEARVVGEERTIAGEDLLAPKHPVRAVGAIAVEEQAVQRLLLRDLQLNLNDVFVVPQLCLGRGEGRLSGFEPVLAGLKPSELSLNRPGVIARA